MYFFKFINLDIIYLKTTKFVSIYEAFTKFCERVYGSITCVKILQKFYYFFRITKFSHSQIAKNIKPTLHCLCG